MRQRPARAAGGICGGKTREERRERRLCWMLRLLGSYRPTLWFKFSNVCTYMQYTQCLIPHYINLGQDACCGVNTRGKVGGLWWATFHSDDHIWTRRALNLAMDLMIGHMTRDCSVTVGSSPRRPSSPPSPAQLLFLPVSPGRPLLVRPQAT